MRKWLLSVLSGLITANGWCQTKAVEVRAEGYIQSLVISNGQPGNITLTLVKKNSISRYHVSDDTATLLQDITLPPDVYEDFAVMSDAEPALRYLGGLRDGNTIVEVFNNPRAQEFIFTQADIAANTALATDTIAYRPHEKTDLHIFTEQLALSPLLY